MEEVLDRTVAKNNLLKEQMLNLSSYSSRVKTTRTTFTEAGSIPALTQSHRGNSPNSMLTNKYVTGNMSDTRPAQLIVHITAKIIDLVD